MYRLYCSKIRFFLVALFASYVSISSAQNTSVPSVDSGKSVPLPTIRVNVGFANLFSDVKLHSGPSPFTQLGYQLSFSQPVAKFLNVSFDLFTGSVVGDETRRTTNINYRSTLFSQFLLVDYNLFPLLRPKEDGRQLFRPFIGFGVGMTSFRSKGDLKDANGKAYQFWSDGTIRAEAEGTVDPSESTLLQRDYTYETDLRAANLDGFKNYYPLAFSMPFRIGFEFQITKHFGVNASAAYVLNFTDLIDNVNENSVGSRQGSSGNDNHIYGSVGLSFFLGSSKAKVKAAKSDQTIADNASDLNKSESSTDDRNEVAEETQSESEMSASENANVQDTQKSVESNTSQAEVDRSANDDSSTNVNSNAEKVTPTAVEATPIRSVEDIKNAPPKETGNFHWADLDDNGSITPNEVLHFIDLLFEGTSEHNVEDIQQLIDYYFEQE